MARLALPAIIMSAAIGLSPAKADDAVSQSDVAAVMTTVPREGAAHHALVKRKADESLNDLFGRAFSECGDARCRVVGVWQWGDCLTVVQGKKYIYWAWGSNSDGPDQPRARAMASCMASAETCNVLTSECFSK